MRKSRRIGRYHVMDRVSAGGMAEVYRARVIESDGQETLVALKKVLEQYARDPGYLRMLRYEYRLASLLRHPNIAVIHEFLRSSDAYYIAMEYVDGKDLRATQHKMWEKKLRWEIADAVYVMARALDGLHHAHTSTTEDGRPLNLVHRDFSPSNIILSYDGVVKLIDFGIAKAAMPRDQTAAGIIKGKVRYMSPEQANGDDRLTAQSDVFSAGTVLYELLSGEAAFVAPNELELIYTVRRAQPKPIAEIAPHVPDVLVNIVRHAMARGRKSRFETAADFRDELVAFLRAYAPGYRRTRLANHLRSIWQLEIDAEINVMLEYVMSEEGAVDAENLLETASIDESISAVSMFSKARDLFDAAEADGATDFDQEQPATIPGRKPSGKTLAPSTDPSQSGYVAAKSSAAVSDEAQPLRPLAGANRVGAAAGVPRPKPKVATLVRDQSATEDPAKDK
jgi:serine/threonine-protein kinase